VDCLSPKVMEATAHAPKELEERHRSRRPELTSLPLYLRAVAPPVGVICDSKHFGYYAYADPGVESAEIRGAGADKLVWVSKDGSSIGRSYVAPLGDRSIGDDAIIEFK